MTSTISTSLFPTTMQLARGLGKNAREKLDHIQSRFSSQGGTSAEDQPGTHISSRDGGGSLPPADFPTQADFFKFRKQRGVNFGALYIVPVPINPSNFFQARGLCWRAGLQIAHFGKLTHPAKATTISPGEHMPEKFYRTIGEIGSLRAIGPG